MLDVKVSGNIPDLNIDEFLHAFINEFQTRVERRTPVRSGLLQQSYYSEVNSDNITLNNSQDYIHYVEEGTSHFAPSGMTRTTAEEVVAIVTQVQSKLTK